MRIAFLSDTHGNYVALKAVLADLKVQGADQLIFLGDAATIGSHPRETLQTLQELKCNVHIMGNHDEAVLHPERAADLQIASTLHDSLAWTIDRMSGADLDYLQTFCPTYELELNAHHSMLCFHGSPRSNTDVLLATTPTETLDELFGTTSTSIWVGGHTHVQLFRRYETKLLLNSGSIGNAFKSAFMPGRTPELLPWAEYTLLDVDGKAVSADLRRVPFDAQEVLRQMSASGNPAAAWWLDQYK